MNSVDQWVQEIAHLCQPKDIHFCDGSAEEYRHLCHLLIQKGTFVPLQRSESFWCHSTPDDVARSEANTYICSLREEDAGPTNNWKNPSEMKELLRGLFRGCMQGRTLYVIPFCMGPLTSPYSRFGVQITDSPYVVCNMRKMTRMGKSALDQMKDKPFVPCLHSVGYPLQKESDDVPWPNNSQHKYIVQFPDDPSIWSFGSGYGGNALLSKKCFALRIASVLGRDQGWLAEHMLIIGVTNPVGEKKYFAASFPSGCGKTNLAMLQSILPGWTIDCIGDDIAWLHPRDGQLYAINPENGFFGIAPGTSEKTNPIASQMIRKNTIFTNTALTSDRDVWWEGMTEAPPAGLTSWEGKPWDPKSGKPASHPNARFTIAAQECSILSPEFQSPQGVPISAIIFGGRRSTLIPLVMESLSWNHGIFLGASMASEMTATAEGTIGKLRHDPFAMLPFCGYHMGDYFAHWLKMGTKKSPKIFHVNWFRKDEQGHYLWPGFTHNIHVLKWIFERVSGTGQAKTSPVGYLPPEGIFPSELTQIDTAGYLKDVAELKNYFSLFGSKMPKELIHELEQLEKRLST